MHGLLDHRLLVIAGKGGVGRTTMAGALAIAAARSGRRTIVVELGEQSRLPTMFGVRPQPQGVAATLAEGIDSISIDPDMALLEWLQALGGRVSGRILASSGTFQYFAAAAPGAKELVSMVKIAKLADGGDGRDGPRRGRGRRSYDLVILDAPATGHALGLLGSPQTFGAIARVGPIARQTDQVRELLSDERRSAYVAVATATEMAIGETIDLDGGLRESLGRGVNGVIANCLLPRRFNAAELQRVSALADRETGSKHGGVIASAAAAARSVHERARIEHGLVAKLRRHGFDVATVPFQWVKEMDLATLEALATHLERSLEEG